MIMNNKIIRSVHVSGKKAFVDHIRAGVPLVGILRVSAAGPLKSLLRCFSAAVPL